MESVVGTFVSSYLLCSLYLFQVKKRTKRVSELFQSYHPYTHKVTRI